VLLVAAIAAFRNPSGPATVLHYVKLSDMYSSLTTMKQPLLEAEHFSQDKYKETLWRVSCNPEQLSSWHAETPTAAAHLVTSRTEDAPAAAIRAAAQCG
jgi:hypothetical protein